MRWPSVSNNFPGLTPSLPNGLYQVVVAHEKYDADSTSSNERFCLRHYLEYVSISIYHWKSQPVLEV
jgi:hypothetical protein